MSDFNTWAILFVGIASGIGGAFLGALLGIAAVTGNPVGQIEDEDA